MKKSQKSKIVLCSILGLAAISIGSVGFATWLVGINKTEEELLLEDPNQKESKEVYLTNIKAIFKSSIYWKLFSLSILLTVQPNLL